MRKPLAILLVILAWSIGADAAEVRSSLLAGSWYKANPEQLTRDVDGFLARAGAQRTDALPVGLIVPHAGYRYSGAVAGHAYALLKGRAIERVIILAPCHRYSLEGASMPAVTHYETPLGRVEVDRKVCDAMVGKPHFGTVAAAHAREHSIEIQLPFLQRTLTNFKIVPILIGSASKEALRNMAGTIAEHADGNTLIVASSDFTHYGQGFRYVPFKEDIPDNLRKLDMAAVDFILDRDPDAFYDYQQKTGATICGRLPIYVFLRVIPGKDRGELLKYDTSARMVKDFSSSVSYVSAAFFAGGAGGDAESLLSTESFLKRKEEKILLTIGRRALESYVRSRKRLSAGDLAGFGITDSMRAKRGVFVTLKRSGRLRGCIGYITGHRPVYQAVADNTVNACSRDPRFPAVAADELADITMSISVMSELIPVRNVKEIKVGRDGLVIKKDGRTGILLPQVPVELGWDRSRFLQGMCRKAGLPDGAWRKADLLRFSAQVFHEN